jgi:hypothetical protein
VTLATSTVRALGALSAGLLTLGMLSACTPTPEPDPKPTKTALFASDEEAFKAAEETYREYTVAVNATDLSDPKSIEPVYDFLKDPAEAASRKNYSIYYAEKITRTGQTKFDTVTPVSFDNGVVTMRLCVDVSEVNLVDAGGESVIPDDRADRQPIEIELVEGDSPTGLVIRSNIVAEDLQC